MKNVLAVIPARGGSKGIPRKNLSFLAGLPLIAHSIRHAAESSEVTRCVVTTDDAEIAEVARSFGAEVPVMRPAELAADDTPDLPVFVHLLEWLKQAEGYEPDCVVHLRPTSPLRRSEQVDAAVRLLRGSRLADSVRSLSPATQNPFKMWLPRADGFVEPLVSSQIPEAYNQPRQALPAVLWHNGYVDAVRTRTIVNQQSMSGQRILPLLIEDSPIIDIDAPEDLARAEEYLRQRGSPQSAV